MGKIIIIISYFIFLSSSDLHALTFNHMKIKSIKVDKFDKSGFNDMTIVLKEHNDSEAILKEAFSSNKYVIQKCFAHNGLQCYKISKKEGNK